MKENVIHAYENTVLGLLRNKGFFAKLLMTMRKDFNFPIPTCGVSIMSTGITLHINKDMFLNLTPSEREGVLVHEILHVIHNHLLRFKEFKIKERDLANIACDIAINQYIPNIPKNITIKHPDTGEVITGETVSYEKLKKEIPDLLPLMNAEYYFNKMKKEGMGEGDSSSGDEIKSLGHLIDSHDEWNKSDLTAEQEEKLIKGHIKAVLDSCSDQEKECVDKTLIEEFIKTNIDWKAQLRSFLANSEETFTESTRKKRNRRYGIIQPGHKNEAKMNLCIAVDTSGSMSEDSLKLIFGEIERIFDVDKNIVNVIEADCVIQQVYRYKKGMTINAQGRGGTAYQPAFDKAKELNADAVIYCGDFDCSDTPSKPRFPTLWAGVGKQEPPVPWGKVIRLD